MIRHKTQPGFPSREDVSTGVALYWLGQAGFWIETPQHSILIDPYLSDSLAKKYAGKKHDHKRMMPPPVAVDDLPRPDLVLITHAHTDHMDPDTLGPLFRRFPDLPFVVPATCETQARARIGADARLILTDADRQVSPIDGLTLHVFPAAHEALERDAAGRHVFIGYGIETRALRLYHSGDSIPFDGLDARIASFAPDIMMLPVNGRDAKRLADGIPGNFTFDEAIHLARHSEILIPHHFDMFAFNTVPRAEVEHRARHTRTPKILPPVAGQAQRFLVEHQTSDKRTDPSQ